MISIWTKERPPNEAFKKAIQKAFGKDRPVFFDYSEYPDNGFAVTSDIWNEEQTGYCWQNWFSLFENGFEAKICDTEEWPLRCMLCAKFLAAELGETVLVDDVIYNPENPDLVSKYTPNGIRTIADFNEDMGEIVAEWSPEEPPFEWMKREQQD